MRILLFLGTNIAVMALLGLSFSLFGIQGLLAYNGVDLNFKALLVYAAVIGFSGAFIFFLYQLLAKRSMKVHIIVAPENPTERWLFNTVQNMAKKAEISIPEVCIFSHFSPNAFATMIVMCFLRYREFKADASGAKLAGNNNMIGALKRLQSFKGGPKLPDEMTAFAINADKVQAIFSRQPPFEQRIKALQNIRL
jgi:Zn-dependent protease with chaperone function